MRRYIDADKLIETLDSLRCGHCTNDKSEGCILCQYDDFKKAIGKMPTADVVEVRHGEWTLKDNNGNGVCSVCNRQDRIDSLANYCRYCGAKMNGEKTTEKKLNAETIKKGLRNFINNTHTKIYYPGGDNLIVAALALIDKLTVERDRYKRYYLNHDYDRMELSIKAETISEINTKFAIRYGTYTDKDMTPITEVFRILDKISKELEEGKK